MSDRIRQVAVSLAAVLGIAGAALGSGAFGGVPVQDAAGGALAADATPIAPAGPAFSIWSVIYLGLAAYAIWQWLPSQTASPRHRAVGWWVAASLLLNAAWIGVVQAGQLALSVAVILVLLAVLIAAFLGLQRYPSTSVVDAVITDGTVGLYLGWVCVATAANMTALLVDAGFDGFGLGAGPWSVLVLAVAALAGIALAIRGRGRFAPALALGWGLAWVAVGRLTLGPDVPAAAGAAIAAALVVLAVTVALRIVALRIAAR